MSAVLLIDTNIWSHLVQSLPEKKASVQAQLQALYAKYPGATRATSALCVAECRVAALRLLDEDKREAADRAYADKFANDNLMVVDVSQAVLDKAAELRAEVLRRAAATGGLPASADGGRLKMPDAIVAASCFDFGDTPAILVTENTKDFTWDDAGVTKGIGGLTVERVV